MGTRSTVKGLCMVNVAWEEQANGPEGAYCRVELRNVFLVEYFTVTNLSLLYVRNKDVLP